MNLDTLGTLQITEKPQKNLCFSMVFIYSAKLLQNHQNAAVGCPGTYKMEAWGAQNDPPGRQNQRLEHQNEAQERQDGPSKCQNGCSAGL